MKSQLSRAIRPWILIGACWGLAFALACRLLVLLPDESDIGGIGEKVMGSGRSAVSGSLYETAELYFHKGVGSLTKTKGTDDWFQRSLAEISPRAHRHTEGGDCAEILPWLRMATRADPHNVEAFLVMAFWLVSGVNRPDVAIQVLAEAQRYNPRDYRISQEQGRLAIHMGKFAEGRKKMEAALIRWPSGLPEDRQALLDKAELFILLGFLCEDAGMTEEAVGNFKNALAIFPERAYISERVTMLQSGRAAEPAAREALGMLVKRSSEDACSAGSGEHDDHEQDEHEAIADRKARTP